MLLTVGITASAQEALDSRHTIVSPEIHDDNRVTFRLKTPDHVASVRVGSDCFSSGGADLKKNAEGIWEYTTPEPLPSELYSYFYVVDGMMMLDPSNVYIVRDVSTTMNIFIIGGGIGDLYKVNAVPHGTVSRVWYDSPSLQMKRRLSVYTPAGYDPGSKRKYPVLYLLHGMGGDEEAWLTLGRVAQIMDNLIAARKAHPMIVVMRRKQLPESLHSGLSLRRPICRRRWKGHSKAHSPISCSTSIRIIAHPVKSRIVPFADCRWVGSMPNLYRHDTPTCSIISDCFRQPLHPEKKYIVKSTRIWNSN